MLESGQNARKCILMCMQCFDYFKLSKAQSKSRYLEDNIHSTRKLQFTNLNFPSISGFIAPA